MKREGKCKGVWAQCVWAMNEGSKTTRVCVTERVDKMCKRNKVFLQQNCESVWDRGGTRLYGS